MRDPDRISPMLEALEELWRANYDLRLGQLISILSFPHEDSFYIEDDTMLSQLQLANEEGIAALTPLQIPQPTVEERIQAFLAGGMLDIMTQSSLSPEHKYVATHPRMVRVHFPEETAVSSPITLWQLDTLSVDKLTPVRIEIVNP